MSSNQKPFMNKSKRPTPIVSSALFGSLGIIVGILIYHYAILGYTLDRRAQDLGWMQYSAQADKMVAEPEHRWDLQYLKHGTMN